MIEVKLHLYDAWERAVFGSALQIIENRREGLNPVLIPTGVPATPTADEAVVTAAPPVAPPVALAAQPLEVKPPADAEDRLRAYLAKHGLAEARRLLAQFGVKRLGELADDKVAEFLTALETGPISE